MHMQGALDKNVSKTLVPGTLCVRYNKSHHQKMWTFCLNLPKRDPAPQKFPTHKIYVSSYFKMLRLKNSCSTGQYLIWMTDDITIKTGTNCLGNQLNFVLEIKQESHS